MFFFVEIRSVLVCFLIYYLFISFVFNHVLPPIIEVCLIEYFTMRIFCLDLHFFSRVAVVHFLDIGWGLLLGGCLEDVVIFELGPHEVAVLCFF